MRQAPKLFGLSLIAVALIQSVALGKLVYDRVTLLRTGQEVVLELVPRDPRDLFRGYYSNFDYRISSIPKSLLAPSDAGIVGKDGSGKHTRTVYVVLRPDESGAYVAESVHLAPPPPSAGRIVARGTVDYFGGDTLRVEYGIESYFLPQDKAAALDLKERDSLRMVASVGPDGEMAIKRLLVNGQEAYEEAPF